MIYIPPTQDIYQTTWGSLHQRTKICDWVTTYGQMNPRLANFLYPNQEHPTSNVWSVFVTVLRNCFAEGTNNIL